MVEPEPSSEYPLTHIKGFAKVIKCVASLFIGVIVDIIKTLSVLISLWNLLIAFMTCCKIGIPIFRKSTSSITNGPINEICVTIASDATR